MQFSDYLKTYRQCIKEMPQKKIQVAFLSMFTIKGLKEVLTVKAFEEGIGIECYEGAYRQVVQEAIGWKREIMKPDITFVLWDAESLLGDYYVDAYKYTVTERREYVEDKWKEFQQYVTLLEQNIPRIIVFHNFEYPAVSPLGIMETKQEFGLMESLEYLNRSLAEYCRNKTSVYIFDYAGFKSRYGEAVLRDNKMYYLGDMKISMEGLILLADEYLSYIRALAGKSRKCLVLDLDNTLWGGIIGEDGMEHIKLGPDYEGKAYREFQIYIKSLLHRGVILAVNSKNNYEDAMEVIENHDYMVLRKEDFAAFKINWQDKVSNMKELAAELNIGLDSMVFVDDDRINCDMMETGLPMVKTIHLNGNPVTYVDVLRGLTDFNMLSFTEEDRKKNEQYRSQVLRNELKSNAATLEDFIKSLDIRTRFEEMNDSNIGRISQLTMKTNQFNLTTRRYTESDLNLLAKSGYKTVCLHVADRYGDNGICGVLIFKPEKGEIMIDTMLLSCRVMGRKIEEQYFEFLEEVAEKEGVSVITGEYIPTPKNKPVEGLYREHGFVCTLHDEHRQIWRKNIKGKENVVLQ